MRSSCEVDIRESFCLLAFVSVQIRVGMVIELFVAMVSQLAVIMVQNANAKADQVAKQVI